ncbi:MAG: cytochrome c family protein, partial [Pseudomonadota bacterium]
MDTMTFTKAGGSLCAALLVFLLGAWGAESLYHVGSHGHGDEHTAGFVIAVDDGSAEDGGADAAEAEPEIPFEEVYASASA